MIKEYDVTVRVPVGVTDSRKDGHATARSLIQTALNAIPLDGCEIVSVFERIDLPF